MTDGSETRWRRIETLFNRAHDLNAGEREAFLSSACASDVELRSELESLLQSSEMTFSPLAASVSDAAEELLRDQTEELTRLGAYRLVRPLGQGGMGTVYLGARDDEQYVQTVAIKVLRAGLAHRLELQSLFRNERQILADFDHANIARLLDGGLTPGGSPYLVMEYVDGTALDTYCDEKRLSLEQRLELARTLCGAVAYAHRHLVIHRDIKPQNVLVTSKGTLKLLDFGIAKLIDPLKSQQQAGPGGSEFVLTPDYASPEQLLGRPISTATDVYALGLLIFELMTGELPFAAVHPSAIGTEAAVRRGEPPKASEVCRKNRHLKPADARKLQGDLDRILNKSLKSEPADRYAGAPQLLEDLERYGNGLPVEASPQTLAYRTGKFVRRHRVGTALSGLIAAVLLASAIGMGVLARRATVGEAEARREEQFLASIFHAATPEGSKGENVTARELLDRAAARLNTELGSEPELEEAATENVGQSYVALGLYDRAQPLLERAVHLAEQSKGERSAPYAEALGNLATDYRLEGDFPKAEPIFRRVAGLEEARSGPKSFAYAHALSSLGECLYLEDRDSEAEQILREALDIERPMANALQDGTRNYLALTIERRGAFPEAAQLLRELTGIVGAVQGKESNDYLVALHNLAGAQIDEGDLDGAARSDREVLATRQRIWGINHPDTLYSLNNLGWIYLEEGRWQLAEPLLKQNLDIMRATPDRSSSRYANSIANWGRVLEEKGDFRGATEQFDEAMGVLRDSGQAHGWMGAKIESYQALGALDEGKTADAVRLAAQAVDNEKQLGGDQSPQLAAGLLVLGLTQMVAEDAPGAEESFRKAVAIRKKIYPPGHTELLFAEVRLAGALLEGGKSDEAATLSKSTLNEARAAQFALPKWRMAEIELVDGLAMRARGNGREAEPLIQGAMAGMRDNPQAAARRYLEEAAVKHRP